MFMFLKFITLLNENVYQLLNKILNLVVVYYLGVEYIYIYIYFYSIFLTRLIKMEDFQVIKNWDDWRASRAILFTVI